MNPDLDALATRRSVTIDDLLINQPDWAPERPEIGIAPKLTDAELITLAVIQALLGFTSEARFIRHAHTHLRALFPYLPQRPAYNKRLRDATTTMQHVITALTHACPSWHDDVWLVDSTPVECGRSREIAKRSDMAGYATYGYCASHSRFFWGLRLQMTGVPQRHHDAGRTLAQMVLALADGATCLSDLAAVRAQPLMFGPVGSEATVWRTFNHVGSVELRGIATARAAARERAWIAGAGPAGDEVIIDIDSTIIGTKADNQDAAATYKRTYGHHPLLAMCAETDEVLAGTLRAGNAGANTAIDHVTLLADALGQLLAVWRAGHDVGDDPREMQRRILVRADSAGASHWLAEECVARNIEFSLGYGIDERVRDGVTMVPTGCWHPAVDAHSSHRDGAKVVELTDLVNLEAWPAGTRLIVRRKRPHPGAQLSLFETIEGFLHTAFITNTVGTTSPRSSRVNGRVLRTSSVTRKRPGSRTCPSTTSSTTTSGCNSASPPTTCSPGPSRSAASANSDGQHPRPSGTGCFMSQLASPRPNDGSASTSTGPGPTSCSTPSPRPHRVRITHRGRSPHRSSSPMKDPG